MDVWVLHTNYLTNDATTKLQIRILSIWPNFLMILQGFFLEWITSVQLHTVIHSGLSCRFSAHEKNGLLAWDNLLLLFCSWKKIASFQNIEFFCLFLLSIIFCLFSEHKNYFWGPLFRARKLLLLLFCAWKILLPLFWAWQNCFSRFSQQKYYFLPLFSAGKLVFCLFPKHEFLVSFQSMSKISQSV